MAGVKSPKVAILFPRNGTALLMNDQEIHRIFLTFRRNSGIGHDLTGRQQEVTEVDDGLIKKEWYRT